MADERISDSIDLERAIWFLLAISPTVGRGSQESFSVNDAILQEDGFFIVQELDGSSLILQEAA